MGILNIIISVAVASSVAFHLYRWMFEDGADFLDCMRFSLTPDLFSLFRGEYCEDFCKSAKFTVFFMAVGLSGYLAYRGLSALIGAL